MILRRLRYFTAVAEEGGISRAASRLLIAQPALSRQIHALEKSVGLPLFERGNYGVRVTAAGTQLREDVERVITRLNEMVRRAVLAHEGRIATLRLGLSRGALISRRVGRINMAFREQYPDVELVVREVEVSAHAQALKADQIDAVIGLGEDSDAALAGETLFEEHVDGVMLAASHRLAIPGPIEPEELRGEPFYLDSVSMPRFPALRAALVRLGFAWEEVEGVDTVFGFVAAGHGWTTALSAAHVDAPAGMFVRPMKGLSVAVPMMLRWRKDDDQPVLRNVIATAKRTFAVPRASADAEHVAVTELGRSADATSLARGIEEPHLIALVTALEVGSLSAAAERLGLTQSAVSRQISTLERLLGVPLIARNGARLVPSAAGAVLLSEAPAILDQIEGALERARRTVTGMTGRCVIGTMARELTDGLLVDTLRQLAERHPEVTVTVVEAFDVGALVAGDIDLRIGATYPGIATDSALSTLLLREDPLDCALLDPSHPLAQRDALTPEDLRAEPLLFVSRAFAPTAYDLIVGQLKQVGLGEKIATGYDGPRATWRGAATGEGWAIGPRSVRTAPPAGVVARPVEGVSIPWGIALHWRREETDPVILRVVDVLRAHTMEKYAEGRELLPA